MLEKQIESKVCDYAKSKGWLTYKFTSPARAAVPDRLMIQPGGKVVFVEFKRTGMKPTEAQLREHKRLESQGCHVWVIDSIESGKGMIDAYSL